VGSNQLENNSDGYKIRRPYDVNSEIWYFSVIDIIQVLIQPPDFQAARNYWKVLKNRLNKEGIETVTKCNRLKMGKCVSPMLPIPDKPLCSCF